MKLALHQNTYVAELKMAKSPNGKFNLKMLGIESQTLTGLIIQDSAESLSNQRCL